ncbi:membrane protein [Paenibacillus baekrokdamisoli]|uniref:Membrane protein n=1 Tax=Paenibacillus baekrokdamisoli TaxID=1712516 RepID=A0A3G9J1X8_9BACL|nr:HupE/UreJ family protein [Paenibacillus baekrokdamisoli]MBB3069359.1 hydrogenase/urease accessory protein HupE [Paenibacillus baekrokdamisoli]BBH18673.1 membrane protein [Paenibacillus baekrokdamisoli]
MFRIHAAWRFSICLMAVLILLLILPFERKVDAHAYSAGYTTLSLTKSNIEMTYTLDELSVIELIGGDVNKNGMLEQEEFTAVKDQLLAMIKKNVIVQINNEVQDWTQLESIVLDRKGDATKVILKASFPPVSASQPISLSDNLYMNDAATNYVDLLTINYGKQKSTAALSGKNRVWAMQLTESDYGGLQQDMKSPQNNGSGQAEGPKNEASSSSEGISGWYSFFTLGINHILSGYDHLLFLFSLLIARQKFKQYAAMITAFTIAHSITLTLTVLGIIDVSPRIVEPAIALSICFVAVDNIVRKEVSYRWVLTFVFGLIHGMGFADILKEMDLPRSQLATDLISFNLGIETVQVTLVAILLPLLGLLHRWRYSRHAVTAGSTLALLLGGIWLAQRLFFN